jgi:hypothetical protein
MSILSRAASFLCVALTAVNSACERSVCLDDCPLPPPPERGSATVTINAADTQGPILTGGGANFSGLAAYVDASHARLDLLAQMPYALNRVHFSGEVLDASDNTKVDILPTHLPQPSPPPAPWDFEWMDRAVAAAKAIRDQGGADFIMSIHRAPPWMTPSAGPASASAWQSSYATYCARLVSYYNKGSFVDDAGRTVTSPTGPAHIGYWEIWNEPNVSDTNVAPLGADQFVLLFAQVTSAMRAVDPTIKIGGPSTRSDIGDSLDYLKALASGGGQVDFLTINQYQADPKLPDAQAFQIASVLKDRPTTTLPIVIGESNSELDDTQERTGSAFEWAVMPLLYKSHIELHTWRVIRWETYQHEYDLIDTASGQPRTAYWMERTFWAPIAMGGTRVACSPSSRDVACLANLTPGHKLNVVLINIGVASPSDNRGPGVSHEVDVVLADGSARTFAIRTIDRDTPAAGPMPSIGSGRGVAINGYGMATLQEN